MSIQLLKDWLLSARNPGLPLPMLLYDPEWDFELYAHATSLLKSLDVRASRQQHTVLCKTPLVTKEILGNNVSMEMLGSISSINIQVGSSFCITLKNDLVLIGIGIHQAVEFYVTSTSSDYIIYFLTERRLNMTQHIYSLVRNVPIGTPSEVTVDTLPLKVAITADAFLKTMDIPVRDTIAFLTAQLHIETDVTAIPVARCYQTFHVAPAFFNDASKMQYLIENSEAAQELAKLIRAAGDGHTSHFGSN